MTKIQTTNALFCLGFLFLPRYEKEEREPILLSVPFFFLLMLVMKSIGSIASPSLFLRVFFALFGGVRMWRKGFFYFSPVDRTAPPLTLSQKGGIRVFPLPFFSFSNGGISS